METQKLRILLGDPYSLFCEGLRTILNATSDFACVGVATDESEILRLVSELSPDLLIVDLCVSEKIRTFLQRIKSAAADCRIIVLTHCEDASRIESCVRGGADAYLLKDIRADHLLNAIRTVRSGEQVLCEKARHALGRIMDGEGTVETKRLLKDREIEVLTLAAKGFTNKEIGSALEISDHTVASHFITIYRKLDVRTRTEAVRMAVEAGWLPNSKVAGGERRATKGFC